MRARRSETEIYFRPSERASERARPAAPDNETGAQPQFVVIEPEIPTTRHVPISRIEYVY